mmetsp:Transcript_24375/g.75142  ORF Transcript_24375/g.75142 Transcript_24375/m.75142 type:complete len:233 (+) Transcript_24375:219-917(+)
MARPRARTLSPRSESAASDTQINYARNTQNEARALPLAQLSSVTPLRHAPQGRKGKGLHTRPNASPPRRRRGRVGGRDGRGRAGAPPNSAHPRPDSRLSDRRRRAARDARRDAGSARRQPVVGAPLFQRDGHGSIHPNTFPRPRRARVRPAQRRIRRRARGLFSALLHARARRRLPRREERALAPAAAVVGRPARPRQRHDGPDAAPTHAALLVLAIRAHRGPAPPGDVRRD